jgi:hypothetical protein
MGETVEKKRQRVLPCCVICTCLKYIYFFTIQAVAKERVEALILDGSSRPDLQAMLRSTYSARCSRCAVHKHQRYKPEIKIMSGAIYYEDEGEDRNVPLLQDCLATPYRQQWTKRDATVSPELCEIAYRWHYRTLYSRQTMIWSLRGVNILSAVRGEYNACRWTEDFLLVSAKVT